MILLIPLFHSPLHPGPTVLPSPETHHFDLHAWPFLSLRILLKVPHVPRENFDWRTRRKTWPSTSKSRKRRSEMETRSLASQFWRQVKVSSRRTGIWREIRRVLEWERWCPTDFWREIFVERKHTAEINTYYSALYGLPVMLFIGLCTYTVRLEQEGLAQTTSSLTCVSWQSYWTYVILDKTYGKPIWRKYLLDLSSQLTAYAVNLTDERILPSARVTSTRTISPGFWNEAKLFAKLTSKKRSGHSTSSSSSREEKE